MAKLNQDWVVQPHGALTEVDEGIWTVPGTIVMPLGKFPRRMTVLRLASGGTAIWSSIPLAEADMARIEAVGTPRFLIFRMQATGSMSAHGIAVTRRRKS